MNDFTAYWYPKCLTPMQVTSGGLYNIIEIAFDLAPSEYQFDRYKIILYGGDKKGIKGTLLEMVSISEVFSVVYLWGGRPIFGKIYRPFFFVKAVKSVWYAATIWKHT